MRTCSWNEKDKLKPHLEFTGSEFIDIGRQTLSLENERGDTAKLPNGKDYYQEHLTKVLSFVLTHCYIFI